MSQTQFQCGHFERIERSTLEELFSEVAAVRAQNEGLFEFTHREITVYPSEEAGDPNATVISEAEVLDEFRQSKVQNQVTVIEGDTGTGKSELCAYLVHELRDERPILRVDKDDDLMAILTKRLPEFYEEKFDEEMPNVADFERLERHIEEIPRTIASHATTYSLLRFDSKGIEHSYTKQQKDEITDIVEKQLQQLVTQGEYGKDKNLITEELYERKDCLALFDSSMGAHEAIEAWNRELWAAIRDEYETPQLSELLRRVGERFTETRPVIVFEDFSIASIEARQLRNYMEDDPEDNWDFIIAGTRDVTEVLHTQTAEARFSFYQTNEPDSNSVLFLDEDSAVEFIRPYLGYIKHHLGDGSVMYNRKNGDLQLQKPEAGSICDECGLCAHSFRDLYPFTETFLERIYKGLDSSERSPRKYVTKVFNILDEYYSGAIRTPAESARLGSDVSNSETPADDVYDQAEDYAKLAKWYGLKSDGAYAIPIQFVKAFGLSPEKHSSIGIEERGGQLMIPAAGESGGRDDDSGGDGGDDGGTEKSLVERRYEEYVEQVDDWLNDPKNDKFTQTNDYITDALTDLIERVTDNYSIWTDCSLRYNLSQNKEPYVLAKVIESPDDDQIILDQREFRRSEIRSLLMYGIRMNTEDADPDPDKRLEEMGTQIVGYGRKWRQQVINIYIDSDRTLFSKKGRGRYDFEDFVIASYAWLAMLHQPAKEISAQTLNEVFTSDVELSLNDELSNELGAHISREEQEVISELFGFAENIEQLVESRFAISSNALDKSAVEKRLSTDPYKILSSLAKTRIDNINSRIRFSSSAKLPEIATSVYNCVNVVEDAAKNVDDHYHNIEGFVLTRLSGVEMAKFSATAQKLEALSSVDREFNSAVQQFAQLDQKRVDETLEAAEFISETDPVGSPTQNEIQIGLARMRLAGGKVFSILFRLDENWATPADSGDGSFFKEVAEHYVD